MESQQGFTLIEIIVSLMLVSILAAAAGFGLVEVAKSYQFARENTVIAQKAHIALQRISLELMDLSTVTSANATNVVITTPQGNRSIGLYTTDIKLDDDTSATDGEILINQVSDFQMVYINSNDQPWTTAMSADQLFGIEVSLTLSRGDGMDPVNFATQINPRNNQTLNAPS